MSCNGKKVQQMTRLKKIYVFEKKMTPRGLSVPRLYIYVYDHHFQKSSPLKLLGQSKPKEDVR